MCGIPFITSHKHSTVSIRSHTLTVHFGIGLFHLLLLVLQITQLQVLLQEEQLQDISKQNSQHILQNYEVKADQKRIATHQSTHSVQKAGATLYCD